MNRRFERCRRTYLESGVFHSGAIDGEVAEGGLILPMTREPVTRREGRDQRP
jgi:hypothetical protein